MDSAASKPRAESNVEDEVLIQSATFQLPPIRLPFTYQAGLFVVTLAMVVLPLLYAGLIVLLGYGVWFHATNNLDVFVGDNVTRWSALAYVAPIVAGVIAVLFMVKPFFAPSAKHLEPRSLSRQTESKLYAFVERLCQSLGAPAPRLINVDLAVNASASFRRGVGSFWGNDLVLTIGLPLAGGLSVTNLAGVLAHEFGHFTQGAAMRLTYVIRTVNHWFARVVYERDKWDLRLQEAADKAPLLWIQIPILVAIFFVWLSRRVLWILMYVGHGVSGFLSRQMEYHADEHQWRTVGTDAFRETHLQIHLLAAAESTAFAQLRGMWRERRLPDDVVHLISETAGGATPGAVAELEGQVLAEESGWLDTHPSTNDRIARAARQNVEGALSAPFPAAKLFHDFGVLCRDVSVTFYRENEGLDVDGRQLISAEQMRLKRAREQDAREALKELLGENVSLLVAGAFPRETSRPETAAGEQFSALRDQVAALSEQCGPKLQRFHQALADSERFSIACKLIGAGIKVSPSDLELPSAGFGDVLSQRSQAEKRADESRRDLAPFLESIGRLGAATLESLDATGEGHPDSEDRFQAKKFESFFPVVCSIGGFLEHDTVCPKQNAGAVHVGAAREGDGR